MHCSLIELSLWKLPPRPAPLFFRAPKVTSRRPQTLPSAFGPLLHRSLACVRRETGEEPLERAARALQLSLWKLPPWPAPLFFRAPKVTSRRPQTLPSAFGLLLRRSLACLKPFPAPMAHSCVVALPTSGGSLGRDWGGHLGPQTSDRS